MTGTEKHNKEPSEFITHELKRSIHELNDDSLNWQISGKYDRRCEAGKEGCDAESN